MAGPWEDFAPQAESEEVGPWTEFKTGAPTVRPGDVEARKRQVLAQTQAEKPIEARERVSISGELTGGISDVGGGLADIGRGIANLSPLQAGKGLLGAGLGAVRAVASPLAPLTNISTEAGEATSRFLQSLGLETGADIGGALVQSVLDVAGPSAISKVAAKVKPAAQALVSPRMKAAQLKEELAASTTAGEAEIARLQAAREAVPAATAQDVAGLKGQMQAVGTREAEQIATRRASQQAAEESVMSIAEAGAKEIPTASVIREKFAKGAQLGENVGEQFKNTYKGRLQEKKTEFSKLYDEALEGTEDVTVPATNYLNKIDETLAGRGATRPLPTQAEKVAVKAKDILDAGEDAAEQVQRLSDDIASARGPEQKRMLQGALDEFLTAGELPENPTVRQLVQERQRLKAAQRVAYSTKNDNLYRQLTGLVDGITADLPPGVAQQLASVDRRYLDEFVPFFSKKSVTRAIAEGSPQSVVDSIIRPVTDKKSVEKVQRAWELMDDGGREATKKAFVNKGVESAVTDKGFDAGKFTEWWRKHSDVTGTGDKVLKTVFGAEYGDVKSVVNQLQSARRMSLDDVAAEMVKGFGTAAKGDISSIVEKARGARGELREGISQRLALGKQREKAAGVAVKSEEVAQKLMKRRLEKEIADLVGPGGVARAAQRIESIGSGIFAGGTVGGLLGGPSGGRRVLAGGLLVLSSKSIGSLLSTVRGRSLFKAVLRGAPGTSQAAATARQVQNFLQSVEGED